MKNLLERRSQNSSCCDFVFYFGMFLIPFDNLPFALTAGWATFAPFVFLLYSFLRFVFSNGFSYSHRVLMVIAFLVLYSSALYVVYPPEFDLLVQSVGTLILGLGFFSSIDSFFFGVTQAELSEKLDKLIRVLMFAYSISFFYGILYIIAFNFYPYLIGIFEVLQKRYYFGRMHFTFTEPSFISMHLYGVIAPILFLGSLTGVQRQTILAGFVLLVGLLFFGMIFSGSVRLFFDTFVVLGLFLIGLLVAGSGRHIAIFIRERLFFVSMSLFFMAMIFIFLVSESDRLQSILSQSAVVVFSESEGGGIEDASFASRLFRMNSLIYGFSESLLSFLFGVGLSNAHYVFFDGYDQAFNNFYGEYYGEVYSLFYVKTENYFSMPLRLISEFGIFFLIALLVNLYRRSLLWFYLPLCYLYIQFDSYAFYSFWIYLYILYVSKGRKLVLNSVYGH